MGYEYSVLPSLWRLSNPTISNNVSWKVENLPCVILNVKRHSYCAIIVIRWINMIIHDVDLIMPI